MPTAIPVIPQFEAGDSHLHRLQQLSSAVSFTCRIPVVFHLYKTANQSIPQATQTAITWDAASADSDGGWALSPNPSRYTVQTAGFFHLDAGLNIATSATDAEFVVSLRVTTGPSNPFGAGAVTYIGSRSDDMSNPNGPQEGLALSASTPYLYATDYVEVIGFCTQALALTAPWNSSGNNDLNGFPDGSPWFTGALISPGTWNGAAWTPA